MTAPEIIKLRLVNQQIAATKFVDPQQLVTWMAAIQSQDYGMAKWAIGLRLQNLDDASVEKAFNEGKILRTHVLRPTWHFVTPQDIRWMLELTAPRILPFLAYYDRILSLEKKVLKKCNDVLAKALQGGKQLTRDEVNTALQKTKIDVSELRFIHILQHAELDRVICSGARKGKQFTYALFDERVPLAKPMQKEEALAELTRCFFTSRGPATIYDFAWWSGLSVTDAKKGIEIVKGKFKKEVIDGKEYYFKDPGILKKEITKDTYLLPNYDEYVVSYKDRTEAIDKKHLAIVAKERNAVFTNSILVNGMIEGTWKRAIKNNSVVIKTKMFSKPNRKIQRGIVRAAKNYCQFLKKELQLS
jgi:hypothetical protein